MNKNGSWDHMLQFSNEPQENIYYMPLSVYGSKSEECPFSHILMVNIRRDNGNCSINDRTFTLRENGDVKKAEIKDEAELKAILKKYFDISI